MGRPPKAAPVFLIILYHISALQTQVLLNPGFGKAIGNSLHFPARGTAPKRGFPKPGSGQTWVSGVLIRAYMISLALALVALALWSLLEPCGAPLWLLPM